MLRWLRVSCRRAALWAATLGAWAMLIGANPAKALLQSLGSPLVDATWLSTATIVISPGVYDYNADANWVGGVAPTGTATFGTVTTGRNNIAFSANTQTNGWTFTSAAPAYTFTLDSSQTLDFFGAGIVINGGSVMIINNNAAATTFSGSGTAGSATITNNNSGSVTFYDTTTAGNAVITNNNSGSTNFYATSTAGSANISNNSSATTNFYDLSTAGSASITNNGSSTTHFYHGSTAGRATITTNASSQLLFDNDSSAGSATITNNANTVFYNSSTAGNATITNGFSGFLYFQGMSKAGSANITNNNVLQFYTSSSAENATITNNYNGTLQFNDNSTAGSATITNNRNVNNQGVVYFSSNASAGSSTITNDGNILFMGAASAGSSKITNNSGSTVTFDDDTSASSATIKNAGTVYFAGQSTGGTAALTNTDASAIIDFRFTSAASLTVGSLAGVGEVKIQANTLKVGGNNLSTTFGGVISSGGFFGTIKKEGTGTLTLSGANTYVGPTYVNAGTLIVTGSLMSGSFVQVENGATLGGSYSGVLNPGGGAYTVGDVILNAGATLAPGTPTAIGTLTSPHVVFDAASFYRVKIDGANADKVVTDIANVAGVVKVKPVGVVTHTTTYTILSWVNSLSGTFSSAVIDGAPLARNPTLSYVGNDVLLTVDAGLLSFIIPSTSSVNQKSIAAAIDNALISGAPLPPGFQALFNLVGPQLLAGLNQVSGQNASGATQTSSDAMNSLMNALFDSFLQGRAGDGSPGSAFAAADDDNDNAMAYLPKRKFTRGERDARNAVTGRNNIYDPRWSVWGSAYGGATTTSGNAVQGTNDVTSRAFGFVTGADYNVTRNTTVGIALGGGGSSYGVAGNLGSGRAEMFQAGLFAKHMMGAAYVSAGLGYTFQNVTTDRTVTIAGNDQLRANFNANTFAGRVEGGYRFATPAIGVTPYAAVQVTSISLPSYGEGVISGNNTFALNYAAQDTTIVRTELGARFDRSFALQTAKLTLRGRAAWAHDEGNNRNVAAVFASLPGSNFAINGAVPSKDLALVSAGADIAWLNNVTLSGTFEGQFGNNTTGYGGKGTVRYVW